MLSITRRPGEAIRIGDDIEITIIAIKGGGVRLGINAPRDVPVNREEVYQRIAEANTVAASVSGDILGALSAILASEQDIPALTGTDENAVTDGSTEQ